MFIYPPKFCISIVSSFSWDLQWSQVFCLTVLLFHLEAIYLPVLKSLVHIYEMSLINHLWLTQIYLYRFYIPEIIRLTNDAQTNSGPKLKLLPHHTVKVMLKYLVRHTMCGNVSVGTCL